jgi:hypothetical protein
LIEISCEVQNAAILDSIANIYNAAARFTSRDTTTTEISTHDQKLLDLRAARCYGDFFRKAVFYKKTLWSLALPAAARPLS